MGFYYIHPIVIHMVLYAIISSFINTILSAGLGIFVFLKDPKKSRNISFALFSVAVFVWSLFYFLWQISNTAENALFFSKLLMVGASFIPLTHIAFIYALTDSIKKNRVILSIFFALSLFISILCLFDNSVVKEVAPVGGFKFWPIAGNFFWLFIIVWLLAATFSTIEIIRVYGKSSKLDKIKLRYVTYGTIVGWVGGITNFFFWLGIDFPPMGNISASIYLILIAYSIVRYRFLDIRFTFYKFLFYFGACAFSFAVFYAVNWYYDWYFGSTAFADTWQFGVILAPIFVFLFFSINKLTNSFLDKIFFSENNLHQEYLKNLAKKLNRHLSIPEIEKLLTESLRQLFDVDEKNIQIEIHNNNNNNNNNNILSYLFEHRDILYVYDIRDDLKNNRLEDISHEKKEEIKRVYESLYQNKYEVCLPLMFEKTFFGFAAIGEKGNKKFYDNNDFHIFNTLVSQFGSAINNSIQYDEIQNFNETLQSKINKQTRELRKTNKDLEKAYKHTQDLLAMKNEFLRIVNHQLNTPISIMKGYLSMSGTEAFSNEDITKVLGDELERISLTVADFWEAYSMEGEEEIKMNPTSFQLKDIAGKMVEEKKKLNAAKERNLQITLYDDKTEVPLVWADAKKITHCVSNLIDNAVFYTREGSINISLSVESNFVRISVKDTGHGITPEDRERLFKKFSRGGNANSLNPNGSGLGLYIAHKIIESSGGEIRVESEGLDKGSEFSFTLPIYNGQASDNTTPVSSTGSKIEFF